MLPSLKESEVQEKLTVAVMVPGERDTVLKVCELQRNAGICYGLYFILFLIERMF